jgi:glycosyltransferase involved in cell wall biosynthesis
MMSRLRILMLITNLGKGGAQRVFYDHARAFSAFHDVEEAVFDIDEDERIYDSGLPIHSLRCNDLLSRLGPLGRIISRSRALRRLAASNKFDVVVSHMDGANWVNVLSFSQARKVLVVHGSVLHDGNFTGIRQWLRRKLILPILYNQAECTVAVSQGIRHELSLFCKVRNACSIPNFVDLTTIRTKSQAAPDTALATVFEHPSILITAGRLAKEKRQVHLLNITERLIARGIRVRAAILGDGELRDHLIRHARGLGLRTFDVWSGTTSNLTNEYDVYFLGYVSNPFQYLARSTLFLFPSRNEGYPLALCEAMCAGVPVMSADCPTGPREILAPGTTREAYDLRSMEIAPNGVLLPIVESEADLNVWDYAVESLLQDGELRERLRLHAKEAVGDFGKELVVGAWLDLLAKSA